MSLLNLVDDLLCISLMGCSPEPSLGTGYIRRAPVLCCWVQWAVALEALQGSCCEARQLPCSGGQLNSPEQANAAPQECVVCMLVGGSR